MSGQPVVTVVMAAHNAERYVSETIDSILAQTLSEWELIAIDDGSTDATQKILDRYAANDPRIRLIRQNNSGLAASLNTGIAEARGSYIARIDADDVAMPHRLAIQIAWLDAHREVHALGSSAIYLADGIRSTKKITVPTEPSTIELALRRGNCMIHSTIMLRSDSVRKVGGYRKCFVAGQDYDLWLRMSEHGKLANLAEPLIYYRFHAEQAPHRKLSQQVWAVLAAQHSAIKRRASKPDPLDGVDEIIHSTLRNLGISELESDALASAFESRISTHFLLNQPGQAMDYGTAFANGVDQQQWRRIYKPRLDWQFGKYAWRHRRRFIGIKYALIAAVAQPSLLIRQPRHLCCRAIAQATLSSDWDNRSTLGTGR